MTHIFDGHLLMPLAYPKTRPGQFGHEPWKESKLGLLEQKREAWSASLEHRKQHLKRLQDQSDSDTERIEIVNKHVQSMLSILENLDTEIMLEKQPEKKLRKTAKVSKQQEKKLRQIAKSGKQIAKSGKQTTKVPKQQKKDGVGTKVLIDSVLLLFGREHVQGLQKISMEIELMSSLTLYCMDDYVQQFMYYKMLLKVLYGIPICRMLKLGLNIDEEETDGDEDMSPLEQEGAEKSNVEEVD
ncbi:heat shock protein [Trifolium repens]|nr:heat shock protein [Trifolium repens]